MDLEKKLSCLERLYRIYDGQIAGTQGLACEKGCAVCCTRNVTATTLEGHFLIRYLTETHQLERLQAVHEWIGAERFIPLVTTNQIAALCLADEALPEEEPGSGEGGCGLLKDRICSIYPVRPFACRCMVSTLPCGDSGYARMDDFVVTLNNVFLQIIEQLDLDGWYGNLADVLAYLADTAISGESAALADPTHLIRNIRIPALMIPPEHRDPIAPVLEAVRAIA